ncbi:MAG: hypothetical protein JXJ19_05605 [Elusimicrobia bacterium]|nr:hypothetical protein [Elusimicrobiota bacterium]
MEIIDNISSIDIVAKQAVTIGNFDGFHKGHQEIASFTIRKASEHSLEPAVITFKPEGNTELLTTLKEKLVLFENAGFARSIILDAGSGFRSWSPGEFIEGFLIGKMNASYVVTGEDFRFGKDRSGTIRTFLEHTGISAVTVPLKEHLGLKISSTHIRNLLNSGNLDEVTRLLGREYSFSPTVIPGEGFARTTGFPTVNFFVPDEKLLPPGIYLAKAVLGDKRKPAAAGACFIGNRENGKEAKKEMYFLDYFPGLEKDIEKVLLLKRIREPRKFANHEELTAAIINDINKIKGLYNKL